MCYITATELKSNLGYYLNMSQNEDVYVTKNKKVIAVLTNAQKKVLLDSKYKSEEQPEINPDVDYDKLLTEAIMEKCGF